jgi:hypothetical protein
VDCSHSGVLKPAAPLPFQAVRFQMQKKPHQYAGINQRNGKICCSNQKNGFMF